MTVAPNGPTVVKDVEDPVRSSGEILVRVRAASVNRLDAAVRSGAAMGGAASFPLIQGIDAAGEIVEGSGSLMTGLRVAVKPTIPCNRCRWCRRGVHADCSNPTMFGIHRQGGFADLLAVPRQSVVRLPDSLSFVEGAAAAHTHTVALRMIRGAGPVHADSTAIVTGAAGALGSATVQLAAALGYRVVAAASTSVKRETAIAAGAFAAVDSTTDFASEVHGLVPGGCDAAFDTTGDQATISGAAASLGRGGRLMVVAARPDTRISLDVGHMYRSRLGIIGTASSGYDDFAEAYRMLDANGIHPSVASTWPLHAVEDAFDALHDRERTGKVVIDMGDDG